MSVHEQAAPVQKTFFTPGMKALTAIMLSGLGFGLYRMFFGLEAVTNLNDQYPLGLWIGVDVATGVALAAGGFTSSALVYIFNREHFHAVIRPALLTATAGLHLCGHRAPVRPGALVQRLASDGALHVAGQLRAL